MNKTLSIALAGFSFVIDEHAYIKLSEYLSALRNNMEKEEADEVMHDIEIRVVEILKESLGKREVVSNEDVEKVISLIGTPEEIEGQEETYYADNTKKPKMKKQLFRDPTNKKIAGVCSGLANYFNMDVTLMRGIWAALAIIYIFFKYAPSLPFITMVYLILWAILPKAQTASDFLKMKGEPANFDNIKTASMAMEKLPLKSESEPLTILRYILGGMVAIVAVGFLFATLCSVGFTSILHFTKLSFYYNDYLYLIDLFLFFTLAIPTFGLSLLSIKLLSPKTSFKNTKYIFFILIGLWIITGLVLSTLIIKGSKVYSGKKQDTENIAINTPSDTLFVGINKIHIPESAEDYDNIFTDKKTVYDGDNPDVEVSRKDIKIPYLEITRIAEGYNLPLKSKILVKIEGNNIELPNYILFPYSEKMRKYRVKYTIVVPKDMVVINEDTDNISLNDDSPYASKTKNGDDDDDDDNDDDQADSTQVNRTVSMNITRNGNKISIQSINGKDKVTINGKTYSGKEAKKKMDSLNIDTDSDDMNINFNVPGFNFNINTPKTK
ncbi:PspC domain-containing protein [Riemerella columbipharyngis]|uniref:Phage shock protein PspC (Stress-responsive transcriptional regulator) n=1 Tax=Riemerella columbipharyngis TaxID=1071918 RepID=A0A1G6YB36_9FLAO|nr:PspC domain-containing protein [Riemerella columbipharyngis]SDD87532.1 Phage shock protein PspC (stress-responsive transcriptional regulator) [Riemerella columbipharyngis]